MIIMELLITDGRGNFPLLILIGEYINNRHISHNAFGIKFTGDYNLHGNYFQNRE